jgi:pSer/pThr/pTyr-binding forkhead associated (FHA) protein
MLAILLPCGGGPEIPILAPTVTLGRHPDCDVPLAYRSISGRHCELQCIDGFWRVRDLGSSNGTRVNGITVSVSWLLPDEELTLGKERFYLVYIVPEGRRPPPLPGSADTNRKPPPKKLAVRRTTARAWTLGELVPCGGGESIPLLKSVIVVGRTTGCEVFINANDVSGRHCQLELNEGYWFARDLGSRNGTRVDNQPCTDLTPVLPDSVIAFGRQRYRLVYTPAIAPGSDEDPFARGLLDKAGLEDWDPGPDEEGEEHNNPGEPL